MSEDRSSSFGWFLAGMGLGALVGVLYAPKSGRETREDIVNGARDGSEYLRARSREAAEQMSDLVDRGKAQVNEYVDRGREYADRGRARWEEIVEKGRDFVGEQSDKVSAALDAGRQAYRSSTGAGAAPAVVSPLDPTRTDS
jgi:gas vesicle protein